MADMQAPVNGNFPAQHSYPESFNSAHVALNTAANFQPAQSSTPTTATPTEQQKSEITKDEVGWFFVEQFYTTLSRNPEKLPLFYSRRSQLVFGTEADAVPVAIGTKAINEKFKQLDFQDCKVRVLNVDSQASFDNILVSVIGEISNKSEPSRKFVQTFVLAEQPNGYYVLNDIFRYLADEGEEFVEEETVAEPAAEAPKVAEPAHATEALVTDEADITKVDEKLEHDTNGVAEQAKEATPQTNGTPAKEETEAAAPAVEAEIATKDKPLTPEPSPVPEKEVPVEKESAPAPAAPKTWANLLAANKPAAAAPVVPAIPAAAPKATGAPAPAAQPAAPAAPAAAAPATEAPAQETPSADSAGWQTAGADHKKTQSRAGEEQTVLGYIKNVSDKIDSAQLKQTLSRFGKLKYFDVSRQKNCAFVEFADPAGYAAAVAANPHQVGGEQILVEERRPRNNAYGANGFNAGRGNGRGRGDRAGSQGRGGFQRDGRGGFAPRGRGGNVAAKNRGQAQAA